MAAAELSAASGAAQVQGGRLRHLAAFMQEEDEGGEAAEAQPEEEAEGAPEPNTEPNPGPNPDPSPDP